MIGEGAKLTVEDDGESITDVHRRPAHNYNMKS